MIWIGAMWMRCKMTICGGCFWFLAPHAMQHSALILCTMAQNGMHTIRHNLHNLCGTQNMRHDVYHLVWLVASNGMQHSARHAS